MRFQFFQILVPSSRNTQARCLGCILTLFLLTPSPREARAGRGPGRGAFRASERPSSRHGDNTSLTFGGQDIANLIWVVDGVFHGYAVEDYIYCWGAAADDPRTAPRSQVGQRVCADSARQSDDGVEVATAFLARRAARLARPVAPTATAAKADGAGVGAADRAAAAQGDRVGREEVASQAGKHLGQTWLAVCANDGALGAATAAAEHVPAKRDERGIRC